MALLRGKTGHAGAELRESGRHIVTYERAASFAASGNVPTCRDLRTCGVFRGNRAPASERAASASLRPLAVHQYSFGSQSCRIRRVPAQSARLSAAKDAAFVTLMSSRRILRLGASGPVRRVAAPASCWSIRGAILRRRIRLLVSLASRLGNPRTASSRLTPPAAPNLPRSRTQVLRLRLSAGRRGGRRRPSSREGNGARQNCRAP